MFDFKKWREDRGLTREQAAEFIGAKSGWLWGALEAGDKNPNRARVLAYALGQYDHSKGMFKGLVDKLSPDAIRDFMIERRDKTGLSFKDQSLESGLGGSTMGNIARDTDNWERVSRLTKTMVIAYMLECAQKETEANKEPEIEVLESVTVPATADMPERTFTHADVVVEVAGVPVEVPQVDPENFERIEHIMVNGSPMWRLADVCRAIDYKNPSDAKNLVRSADIEKSMAPDSMGRNVEQWLVNEYGLLRILAKANTPKTEPFERWVFEEVLPSIRKTGSYQSAPQQPANPIDAMILSLQELKQVQAKQVEMEAELKLLRESTVTADQVAQIAVVKSKEAQAKHRSDLYYIDKHIKNAARELTTKLHGTRSMDNRDVWDAHHASKIKGINRAIRDAVARNYACHPGQAPGRDRYTEADKKTAYAVLNRWREFNGLQTQLALTLEA